MHLRVPLREFEKAIKDANGSCKRSLRLTMRQLRCPWAFLFAQTAECALLCFSKRGILKAEKDEMCKLFVRGGIDR